jgi:hypothetical protein
MGSVWFDPILLPYKKVVFRYDFDGISLLPRGGLTDAQSQVWSAGQTLNPLRFGRFH